MKKFISALVLCVCSTGLFAQYELTTADGKTVQLNANGTWTFKEAKKNLSKYISRKKYYNVEYDSALWIRQSSENQMWDAEFKSKNEVIKATMREMDQYYNKEKVEELLRNEYKDLGIIKKIDVEERTLNDFAVHYYHIKLSVGTDIHTYTGIVTSNENGSFQVSAGGQDALVHLNKDMIEDLIFAVHRN